MQGVLTQLRQVSLTHDAQTISGINTGSIQTSKINDVSFADSPIYSIDQYFDNKHTDKHSVCQYYLKEANALLILLIFRKYRSTQLCFCLEPSIERREK